MESLTETDYFEEYRQFLEESEYWSKRKIRDFQLEKLNLLLEFVGKEVPYYRDLFGKQDIEPSLSDLDDIRKLPLLDKSMVKGNVENFVPDSMDKDSLHTMTTGGTTGDPLKVYKDTKFEARNLANTYYYMSIAGLEPHKYRSVRLHGDVVPEDRINRGEYWHVNDDQQLVMSVNHISSETCRDYVQAINQFDPTYIHSYPSAIYLLTKLIKEHSIPVEVDLECIFCDCETLYLAQKQEIEEVFGCPVHRIYGHTEGAVYGVSCQESDDIHLLPQVGYTELLSKDGRPVTEPGEEGEIVVTGFINDAFPLIRYRTYDIGTLAPGSCECGRNFRRLSEIQGRVQDFGMNKQGEMIPLGPALFDYHVSWEGIEKFKVVQERQGELKFKLELSGNGVDQERLKKRFKNEFEELFNDQFTIWPSIVETLDRTSKGKYRYFDQQMDLKDKLTD